MAKTAKSARDRVYESACETLTERNLADGECCALLMVSGGSDSTALAYLAHRLREEGRIGALAMLHVNHRLRGEDAESDAAFVSRLAELLDIPLFLCEVDVAAEAARQGGNVEAVARSVRYAAAQEALESLCLHEAYPLSRGRIFTAHSADDRIENFYMRSIVGTGPGGFRSMLYRNGAVVRPVLDLTRQQLRDAVEERPAAGLPALQRPDGALWCEDATNAHTDRFRAFVRHEMVPLARSRNGSLTDVLVRTMNLIGDEDDFMDGLADEAVEAHVRWEESGEEGAPDISGGFRLAPAFGTVALPVARRAVRKPLQAMLGPDERIDAAAVDTVLAAFADGAPLGGYTANIQGDLAVSANKRGVLVEPMARFRARRKRL